MRISNPLCLALLLGLLAGEHTALAAVTEGGMDAGAQMERDRRDMERERVMEQIAEDEAARQSKVEQGEKASAEEAGIETSFELKQVNCGSSEILSQEEIAAVTSAYIGRQVTVKDLQEMAGKITDLYREKGYMTCGAVLPPSASTKAWWRFALSRARRVRSPSRGIVIPKKATSRAAWG